MLAKSYSIIANKDLYNSISIKNFNKILISLQIRGKFPIQILHIYGGGDNVSLKLHIDKLVVDTANNVETCYIHSKAEK